MRFLRNPAGAEAVVFRNQHFRHFLVFHTAADLVSDKVRHQLVGFTIDQHVTEVALPDPKTLPGVTLFPKCDAFRLAHFKRPARVYIVNKTGRGLTAKLKQFGIARPYFSHFIF